MERNDLNDFENSRIEILFENDDFLVVNKPAGLPVIPEGWNTNAPYLLKNLLNHYPRLWVVHRLDKPTSGAVLFAKNPDTHRSLNIQFENHKITKVYHAIIEGVPEWRSAFSNQPLRANASRSHRSVVDNIKGKTASTTFLTLKSSDQYALIEASPKTGRTHQIRAHLADLGHPILGDHLYGGHVTELIERTALHSYIIAFEDPNTNQAIEVKAPYPSDFSNALSMIGFD